MNRVKSSAFKMAVFVCSSHVLFSYCNFILSKIFCEFNFPCWLDQRKYFLTEIFPIYSISSPPFVSLLSVVSLLLCVILFAIAAIQLAAKEDL